MTDRHKPEVGADSTRPDGFALNAEPGPVATGPTPDWIEVDDEGKPRGVVAQAGRRRRNRKATLGCGRRRGR